MLGLGIDIFKSKIIGSNISGSIITASITNAGDFTGLANGNYPITQGVDFTSSGSGINAVITVQVLSNVITSVRSIDNGGSGHSVSDTLTITTINSVSSSVDGVLTVTSVT